MKKIFAITCSTFSIYALCGTTACTQPQNSISTEFNQYLAETWHMDVPQDKTLFVLVPGTQCKNCMIFDARKLSHARAFSIRVVSEFDKRNFSHFDAVYEDTLHQLSTLKFINYTSKFVLTEKGKIRNVVQMTDFYRQADSFATGSLSQTIAGKQP